MLTRVTAWQSREADNYYSVIYVAVTKGFSEFYIERLKSLSTRACVITVMNLIGSLIWNTTMF